MSLYVRTLYIPILIIYYYVGLGVHNKNPAVLEENIVYIYIKLYLRVFYERNTIIVATA